MDNTPIEIYLDEHRLIERLLRLIERADEAQQAGLDFPREFYRHVLELGREVADGYHHRREEKILMPLMIRCGQPEDSKMLSRLRRDHMRGRELLRQLEMQLDFAEEGDPGAQEAARQAAMDYSLLIYSHIEFEDKRLFPLAADLCGPEDLKQLQQELAADDGQFDLEVHLRVIGKLEKNAEAWPELPDLDF